MPARGAARKRPRDPEPLVRGLSLPAAGSLVVGIVIGSGIFIGANRLAQGVSSPWMVFAIWIGAGFLTLLGALTYAEFGAALPRSGGDYVYIGRSLSPYWGFFSGWLTLTLNLPWSIATLAVAFASQLEALKPAGHAVLLAESFAIRLTAVSLVLIFTIINIIGVRQSGHTQTFLTVLKLALIAFVVAFGLSHFAQGVDNVVPFFEPVKTPQGGIMAGLALAMVGAFWAYDGWSGVTRVAAEIKEPAKNIPRALVAGLLTIIAIYVLITFVYLLVLGLEGMAGDGLAREEARLVASRAAGALMGTTGERFVAILIMISILGPLNGLTMSGPRVYYAMARDRLFPSALARVHRTFRTPHLAIGLQGLFAAVLALFFSFEVLSRAVVFAAWSQYALTATGLILLRYREPDLPRPYKVPFFPWVPGAFALLAILFILYLVTSIVVNAFTGPLEERDMVGFWVMLANLGVISLSVPAYLAFRRKAAREDEAEGVRRTRRL